MTRSGPQARSRERRGEVGVGATCLATGLRRQIRASTATFPVTAAAQELHVVGDDLDGLALARMFHEAKAASAKFAKEGNVKVIWERLWQIDPRPFNDELIALCDESIRETCGKRHRLPSGPLHDAAEVAAAGVPTVMMFVQSLHGISHNKIEDTKEEHLEMAVKAMDQLASKTIEWIVKSGK